MLGDDFQHVLDGVRRSDDAAFTRLYVDVHPALLRYLRVLSPELAEDVASECWLQVARGLDSFNGGERQFRAWLFTVGRNKLTDRIRYEARRPTVAWEASHEVGPLVRDVADEVIEGESTRRALEHVSRLSRDQAEAVLLRVVADLEYEQIAQLMGRSTGAARVLVHRGLKTLAAAYDDGPETVPDPDHDPDRGTARDTDPDPV